MLQRWLFVHLPRAYLCCNGCGDRGWDGELEVVFLRALSVEGAGRWESRAAFATSVLVSVPISSLSRCAHGGGGCEDDCCWWNDSSRADLGCGVGLYPCASPCNRRIRGLVHVPAPCRRWSGRAPGGPRTRARAWAHSCPIQAQGAGILRLERLESLVRTRAR
ncbi:hypothetical protein B0H16DRAFT_822617 [Mycena metata]|uniref:Uncharacterized protein n=1 Tax=Mycena metata TaxID=1033252 RepID=A0AAD7IXV5_9AGAR|nr:hypothetical protein B0H16DRAFT_822617 [Mycena metata]